MRFNTIAIAALLTSTQAAKLQLATEAEVQAFIDADGVKSIAVGLVEGLVAHDDLDDLEECVLTTKSTVTKILAAVNSFREGTITGFVGGFSVVTGVLTETLGAVSKCTENAGSILKLKDKFYSASNPWIFFTNVGTNIMSNPMGLIANVKEAFTAFSAKNWKEFGIELG
jgi:hypothetical protein